MTTYRYKPLDTTQPSIRLLKVVPGASKDPIQVEIHNAHLDKNPTYVALSYTWDQGQGQKSVKCDGAKIKVERNLYNFLRRFRASPYVRKTKLWIDALCIDQTNIPERNHQVSQMSSIYTAASNVITWLGETTDAEMESLAHKIASYGSDWQAHYSLSDDGVHAAMTHLLCKPYWSRMWVIQEFILAPNLELWWGPYRTNVSNIRGWVEHVNSWNSGKTLLHYRIKARAETASEELEKRLVKALVVRDENFQGLKLRELLEAFTSSECHEKVDKVYALLGIASDVTLRRDLIPVDYSKTPFEVLRDILRFQHLFRAADDDERDLGWVISLSRRMGVQRGDLARYIFLETQNQELQALAFGFLVLPTVPLKFVGKVLRHEHAKRPESQLTPEDLAAFDNVEQEPPDVESLTLSSSREVLKCWPHNVIPSLFSVGQSKSLLKFLDETLSDHDTSEPQSHHLMYEANALKQLQEDFYDALLPILHDASHGECSKLMKPERFVAETKMGQVVYGTCLTEVGDAVHLAILDSKLDGRTILLLDPATPGYANTHAVKGIAKLTHGSLTEKDEEMNGEGKFVRVHLSNCDMLDILDLTRHELLPHDALVSILEDSWEADKKRPQRRFGLSVHENHILEEWFAMRGQK